MSDSETQHSHAAFEAEVVPHMDRLYGAALGLHRDPDKAADLVQETLLRAFRFWHRFEVGTNCRAWLLTILYNTFRNRYRDDKKRLGDVEYEEGAGLDVGPATEAANPASVVETHGLDDELEAALAALRPEFRQIVELVDLQEVPYEEAARIIGRPIGTVRSRLSRARQQLYERLETYGRRRRLIKGEE